MLSSDGLGVTWDAIEPHGLLGKPGPAPLTQGNVPQSRTRMHLHLLHTAVLPQAVEQVDGNSVAQRPAIPLVQREVSHLAAQAR